MCFSATASFTLAAALAPVAAYTLATASQAGRQWHPIAAYPLAFALQQAIEGVVWLGIGAGHAATIAAASRGFLFFSHLFWPAWVPFSIYWLESDPDKRRLLLALTIIGVLFGVSISLPAILSADGISIEVIAGSLEYHTWMIYDGYVGRGLLRVVYAGVVVTALFLASDRMVQLFGGIIVASLLVAAAFFDHAFISVWCYFAAALSAYIAGMMAVVARRAVA
ncbi:MAG: DUF6629 family protein [Hyphomicrobiaceae bacterium]|nr:DUF6629 family protein [Hyphomicrobiaceae bacterium]